MKRHFISSVSAFLLLASPCLTAVRADEAPQLLAKYTFEDIPAWVPNWGAGLGSTYKPATGWKTPFKVSLDPDNPHSGLNSLRFELIESSPKEKIVHSPSIKVDVPQGEQPGERNVLVRLYVRTAGLTPQGAGIRILERDEKGASLRLLANQNSLVEVPNSPTWVELTAGGTLHSRTRSITFMLVTYQDTAPLTIWIDDISVELAPPAHTP